MSCPEKSLTFRGQADLPRLPIPSLDETLDKLPRALEALQTEEEKQETKRVVEEFRRGDGPLLQEKLIQYEQEGFANNTLGSYVESFWDESYLSPDGSVVLNLNPMFVLEESPDPKTATDQIRRAAALTFASVKVASLLKSETLRPDVFKGKTLCMDQFKVLFGAARVPSKAKDTVDAYPSSSHVAVLCRNQFYTFQALWPDGSVAVNEADIADILRAIQKNAQTTQLSDSGRLGVLTSLPRRQWAEAREEFVSISRNNAAAMQTIDSALFVLVLDEVAPATASETAANMLHGTSQLDGNDNQVGSCCNRWYDKLQIIVCSNASTGINFEHSSIDGHTALRFVSDIFAETIVSFAQSITKSIHGVGHLPSVVDAVVRRAATTLGTNGAPTLDVFPKKIDFEFNPSMISKIFYAETALGDQIVSSETVVLDFRDFGKALIVANKMSPDAVVQMSMLLAYYRLYGRVVCMYEPVLTKAFYHGRTEAQRSASPQAAEMCRLWCADSTDAEKLTALRTAATEHSLLVKEAGQGKGVDRHLFALKCIAERSNLPTPRFFTSSPWKTLNHTILSTSNCGNPALRGFGFGPVVSDGFGLGYIIRDDGLSYTISSKHRQTQRYVNMLKTTLLDFQRLLKPTSQVEVTDDRHLNRGLSLVELPQPEYGFFGEESAPPPPCPSTGKYFSLVKEKSVSSDNLVSRFGKSIKLDDGTLRDIN